MALTATASTSNKKVIMQKLCIEEGKCAIIEKLPNKPNVKFIVQTAPDSIEQMLLSLVLDIQTHGKATNKTILFCKTYSDLTEVATTLVSELHSHDCLLVNASDGTHRPICEMYSASTAEAVKDDILQAFTDPHSHIRVVIATIAIAFGMGLDARDVRFIGDPQTQFKRMSKKVVVADVMGWSLSLFCMYATVIYQKEVFYQTP